MKVALTGGTGFVGSHILTELQKHGHEVTALVRDDAHVGFVTARGATPAVVDLHDRPAVTKLLGHVDGAIHTASPGDASSANLDSAMVDAVTDAFGGTGKPYLRSAANGSTGLTTSSLRSPRSTHRRWCRGSCRSNAGCSTRRAYAAW